MKQSNERTFYWAAGVGSREFLEQFRGAGWQSGKMEGLWGAGLPPGEARRRVPVELRGLAGTGRPST